MKQEEEKNCIPKKNKKGAVTSFILMLSAAVSEYMLISSMMRKHDGEVFADDYMQTVNGASGDMGIVTEPVMYLAILVVAVFIIILLSANASRKKDSL